MKEQNILWVLNRRKCSWLPQESTVLLEKPLQGTAARSAIQPNGHFVDRCANSWVEHEEKRSGRIFLIDWDQSRVHLTNVEVDIRQRVNLVLYEL